MAWAEWAAWAEAWAAWAAAWAAWAAAASSASPPKPSPPRRLTSRPPTPPRPSPPAVRPAKAAQPGRTKIEVELTPGDKPNDVWDKYFAANEPDPAAVRQAVRSLMSEQKFDHVIALIEAAIRHQAGAVLDV